MSHLFIVGCARTGSTLLRHVVNRSERICLASETHFLASRGGFRAERGLAAVRRAPERDRQARLRRYAAELSGPRGWRWLERNVSRVELVERLAATDLSARQVFGLLLDLYVERACGLRPGAAGVVVGEKTPAHLYAVPRLNAWFPDARFIHTVRDPRAIFASQLARLRQGRWGPKARVPWLPGALVDPLLAPFEAVRTRRAWLDAVRLDGEYRRLLGDRYLLVRFEDLVTNPDGELRRVFAFLELPFEPRVLAEVDVVGSSFAASRHAGEGIDPAAAHRWRSRVRAPWRTWFALTLRGELGHFGYTAR
ncbi:MAG TPA: sulfotransferase [candidate division Zixibacteria bacterium]|nr:sulfotransferase [candidate division Zixibacteria bacterium]